MDTAFELGWSSLANGDLLREAEARFDVLITTDHNLRYQQNLAGRRLTILVLPTASWPEISQHEAEIVAAANSLKPGEYRELWWKRKLDPLQPTAERTGGSTSMCATHRLPRSPVNTASLSPPATFGIFHFARPRTPFSQRPNGRAGHLRAGVAQLIHN